MRVSFLLFAICFSQLLNAQKIQKITVVEFYFQSNMGMDSIRVDYRTLEGVRPKWSSLIKKIVDGRVKLALDIESPVHVNTYNSSGRRFSNLWIVEPGDAITIGFKNGYLDFSGEGAWKYKLLFELDSLRGSLKKPSYNADYHTKSLEDYLEWNSYLKEQLEALISHIDLYKNKISLFAYNYIRAIVIDQNIDDRSDKFGSFIAYAREKGISNKSVCYIYDTTYYPNTVNWFEDKSNSLLGSWKPIKFEIQRKFGFDLENDSLKSDIKRHLSYYELGLKKYRNSYVREKFLVEFLTKEMIDDLGFIPETENLLAKYYSEPGYPEYKKYVQEFESKARHLTIGSTIPDFSLMDTSGKTFTKAQLKGKVALIHFWFTGCVGCVEMTPALKKIEEEFRQDSSVLFVSISIDEEKAQWLRSLKSPKYASDHAVDLYTGGLGKNHPMIKTYNVSGYPTLFLVDGQSKLVQNPLPDPRNDNGSAIIKLIENQLALMKDGPYVFYKDKEVVNYSFNGNDVQEKKFNHASYSLKVQTDQFNKVFLVSLQPKLEIPPTEYSRPGKLIALSDIEGNFDRFRTLLQSNRVIDENFNWTFGKGHLVFSGDMFDRGKQVTECLWLIYSLEEKAKAAGGYVHFILGNHEIMNLQGDHRYVQQKYKDHAKLMGKSLTELYGESTELGRWLRKKNVIEKIGDLLFTHAGISPEINRLNISITNINQLARQHYANTTKKYDDEKLKTIMSTTVGPFWYRNYYLGDEVNVQSDGDTLYKSSMPQIDQTLQKFNVRHIITGHTIVADTISVHYGGKVINTDTKHAAGKSEALLIEGSAFYRVNAEGKRVLLFVDDKKKQTENIKSKHQ